MDENSGRYTVLRNSPKLTVKFYMVTGLMILMEAMVWFFLSMMSMDDSVEWTGELIFYVVLCLILPVVGAAAGIVGAKTRSESRIYFDGEMIVVDLKFHKPREVRWSELGGIVRSGTMGFSLVDKGGRRLVSAENTMENYNAFYDMAIRKCKDYKKELKKERTGTFDENGGKLCIDAGFALLAFLTGMGISVLTITGILELQKRFYGAAAFFENFPPWGYGAIFAFFPILGLSAVLILRARHCWIFSDSGLELCLLSGKTVRLGWGQIRKIEVENTKNAAEECLCFTLHTAFGKYESGKFLSKGSRDFMLQAERMAERYGFEIKRR